MNTLTNKTALVTGALGGIGHAVAMALAEHGAHLMLHDLPSHEDALREQGNEIHKACGVNIHYACFDLNHLDTIEQQMQRFSTEADIDILVNNAGIQYLSPVDTFPAERWQTVININLSSAFHLCRAVLPGMKKRRFGRIINIASVHALIASINKSAYVAAKHGLLGLTRSIALENAQTPITANCICPGFVMTKLVAQQIEKIAQERHLSYEEMKKQFIEDKHPSGVFIDAQDIGAMAAFLAGPHAQEIRGGAFVIDGGWSIA